ncbi:hypothetical protein G6F57_022600 [Rhizopus arrhizus]|nr:hypothetical protein G6F57_022600 [Rhizopus arrhizus]
MPRLPSRETGVGHAGQSRGQVDDAATIREQGQQRLGEEEDAFDVNVDQRIELRHGRLGKGRHLAVAGVVDQVVERIAPPDVFQRSGDVLGRRPCVPRLRSG